MSELVYLNGEFVQKEDAWISPDDRGFIFADGVYEVIKYYRGLPFRYNDHLRRLERSLSELDIKYESKEKLSDIFDRLLSANSLADKQAGVYIQITRGVHKRVHHFPTIVPTIYAFTFELPSSSDNLKNGIKVITQKDIRWMRCDIKSVSLLPNTMLYNKAVEKAAGESILIRDGLITEATHSSVLGIKNGVVITHPLTDLVLPGITRKVVLEICKKVNIPFEERPIMEKELFDLDELMIAGTGSEVMPVVKVDDKIIGNGKPGIITKKLQEKFFEMV